MYLFFAQKILLGVVSTIFLPASFLFHGGRTAPTPNDSIATTSFHKTPIATPTLPPKKKSAPQHSSPKHNLSAPRPLIVAPTSTTTAKLGALDAGTIITLANAERAKAGLPSLSFNNNLSQIANVKASDMIAKQYFAHLAPDGTDVAILAKKYGYQYLNVGENLALGGFHSSADVVLGWMNSPEHRANILNTAYTEIGVAAVRGAWEGEETWYAVQEFGRPLSLCPSPEPPLKERITLYQNEITALETTLKNLKTEIVSSAEDQAVLLTKTKDYNTIVSTYNTLVASSKVDIEKYNAEARAFNVCAGVE